MACNCIKELNICLAEKGINTKIEILLFGPQVAIIRTVKADDNKREKPCLIVASYCPFCGKKISDEQENADASACTDAATDTPQ